MQPCDLSNTSVYCSQTSLQSLGVTNFPKKKKSLDGHCIGNLPSIFGSYLMLSRASKEDGLMLCDLYLVLGYVPQHLIVYLVV